MITESDIKHAYARAAEDTPPGPDLAAVLDQARGARRRRTRVRAVVAVGLAAVVTGGAVVVPHLLPDPQAPATPAPPAAQDFVAGTSVDEAIAEAVARHLPALGAPRDVFPSDSEHNGPMPDADFARAEDWQAEYDLPDGGLLRLLVAHPAAGAAYDCPTCEWRAVPGGRTWSQASQLGTNDVEGWRFLVLFAAGSGYRLSVIEDVPVPGRSAAEAARTTTDAQLLELAQDPQLTFPAPVR